MAERFPAAAVRSSERRIPARRALLAARQAEPTRTPAIVRVAGRTTVQRRARMSVGLGLVAAMIGASTVNRVLHAGLPRMCAQANLAQEQSDAPPREAGERRVART